MIGQKYLLLVFALCTHLESFCLMTEEFLPGKRIRLDSKAVFKLDHLAEEKNFDMKLAGFPYFR